MSTISAMTTSASRDHIPSNIVDLSNHMCIFALTRANGTLFDASSIQEEDIIEICVWFGHTHPKGVLWHSAIESVMQFHMTDKLQVIVCGVMKALMLCDEAIRVRTSPLSATHVRAYMAAVNGEPSGTQPPPSDGQGESHSSHSNPHPGGRTPQQLQANLGDLTDDELWQLMGDLCWEVALWELNAPPETPTNILEKSCGIWGSWCGWLGGHLSEKGNMGSPGATISNSCPCTKWRLEA